LICSANARKHIQRASLAAMCPCLVCDASFILNIEVLGFERKGIMLIPENSDVKTDLNAWQIPMPPLVFGLMTRDPVLEMQGLSELTK